ncbi:GUN4 domain-containing protein [Nodosilinea sp. AN01ver1]|uniref:GUN4 domain-containing protein n=1 Tax=Nodosilinea sp. AN01ver1 TaxID=3423362 RepID=UPI003D314719
MSHIFISYSRQDQDYVTRLTKALESHRLPVWLDDRIDYGTTWPRVIQDHLEQCAAFLLVMSPRSQDSHWVQCELSMALELRKPVFPLLLEGRRWLAVAALQDVNVMGGKLPPANFFDRLRPYFPTPSATADSIALQDVVADNFESSPPSPVGWAPPAVPTPPAILTPPFTPPSTPTAEDDLSSETGIDYTRLRDLLKAQDWRAADKETYKVMIRAIGKKSRQWFTSDELLNFPCSDLRTIDRLWVKYSQGKFGFSVQKKIYVEYGAKLDGKYPGDKIWHTFCDRVGWRKGGKYWRKDSKYLNYSDLKANPSLSPDGEFPCCVVVEGVVWAVGEKQLAHCWWCLFSRINACKL